MGGSCSDTPPHEGDLEALRQALAEQTRRADYFQRQSETLASRLVKADAVGSTLRHELEQKRRGFTLLANLSAALTPTTDPRAIFQTTCRQINATLNMERTVILEPKGNDTVSIALTHGYDHQQAEHLLGATVLLPTSRLLTEGALLITKENSREDLASLRNSLALPFFIAVPVLQGGDIMAVIITGRTREQKPFMPRLGQGDVETLQAMAAYLAAVFAQGYVLEVEHINQRLTLENERISMAKEQAEALAKAKSDFIAVISHEVRTPMNGVLGLSRLLLDSSLQPEQQELAQTIVSSGETLLGILNEILDLSKLEAGRIELEAIPFSPLTLAEDCLALIAGQAAEKGLALTIEADPSVPVVLVGDPARIRQIVMNLVGNAVKFTERGGLHLRLDTVPSSTGNDPFGIGLGIAITDTGIGISPEGQARLFARYEQAEASVHRRFGGTGLGLSISKQLAELMDGTICVDSVQGQGSTFSITLKLSRPPFPVVGMASQRPIPQDVQGKMALVIDSNPQACSAIATSLRQWGLIVGEGNSTADLIDAVPLMMQGGLIVASSRLGDVERILSDALIPYNAGAFLRLISIHADRRKKDSACPLHCISLNEPPREATLAAAVEWLFLPEIERQRRPFMPTPISPVYSSAVAQLPLAPLPPLSILLAEDNAVNRRVAIGLLERQGATVLAVENGQDALESLFHQSFDLILMDRHMPVMDGIEAVRAIRALSGPLADIPVIALTAAATQDDVQECLDAGMNAFVSKPIDPEQLSRVILSLIGPIVSPPLKVPPALLPASQLAPVGNDLLVLQTLAQDLGNEIIAELSHDFAKTCQDLLEKLLIAQKEKSFKDLEYTSHSLKSAAGFLGLCALADAATESERLAKDKASDAWGVASRLPLLAEEGQRWLRSVLATLPC